MEQSLNWIFSTSDKLTNSSDIHQHLVLLCRYFEFEIPYLLTYLVIYLPVVGGLGWVHCVGVVGRVGLSL